MWRRLKRLFHLHEWETFWFKGNVWTRCSRCGEWCPVVYNDISEVPDGAAERRLPRA